MTLPFRRRHHDDESSHDRARALTSAEMLESLDGTEAGWLARHLESCAECRQEREAFLADRALLRALRERTPEPPRDLWARTSAALEREARVRRTRGRGRPAGAGPRARGLPFGAVAGALIVMVVIGASIIPPIPPPNETPSGSQGLTAEPQATTFEVTAGRVSYIRSAANGSWEFVQADVDAVCPRTRPSCKPLAEAHPGRPVILAGTPIGVTISPNEDQLVIEARGVGTAPDRIYVVPVPSASPTVTPAPAETPTVGPTATPTISTPSGEPVITPEPATPEPVSPAPSVSPDGVIEIASGVMVVGEAAYSADGQWLAFSARPSDGSTGPDLYLWAVDEPTAIAVTDDHRTYFSTWLGGLVLASRVNVAEGLEATAEPSADPTADPSDPAADPSTAPTPVAAHPSSFLLDPATRTETQIAQPDMWLPVVDPTTRLVAYWSGTLVPTVDGRDWLLGAGELVLDGWSSGLDAQPTLAPDATIDPAATPVPPLGPAGTPVAVIPGQTAVFKAKFDPTGTRLAVWISEEIATDVGRLHLVVLDAVTGAVDEGPEPLPGAPALRRFSIDTGRLAWVSPSGQDGQDSAVQVLGWSSTAFGEISTVPAKALYIVR